MSSLDGLVDSLEESESESISESEACRRMNQSKKRRTCLFFLSLLLRIVLLDEAARLVLVKTTILGKTFHDPIFSFLLFLFLLPFRFSYYRLFDVGGRFL